MKNMKNNFYIWCETYHDILYNYYNKFCRLFDEEEKPTYLVFCKYCYENTKKSVKNGKSIAYINKN